MVSSAVVCSANMSVVKKVIVFGATGKTGLAILRTAVKEGLNVTAFVRSPSKVPETLQKSIKIIQGDVLEQHTVENAIEGHDAVLSALGTALTFSTTTVISDGCRNIVSGMKKHGVQKIIIVSIAFLLPGRSPYFFLRKLSEDHGRQLDILRKEKESLKMDCNDATKNNGKSANFRRIPGRKRRSPWWKPGYNLRNRRLHGENGHG